jgi:hypothetical protein
LALDGDAASRRALFRQLIPLLLVGFVERDLEVTTRIGAVRDVVERHVHVGAETEKIRGDVHVGGADPHDRADYIAIDVNQDMIWKLFGTIRC